MASQLAFTLAVVVYGIMLGVGLPLYVVDLITILTSKDLRGEAFYILVISLGFFDLLTLLVYLLYNLPTIIVGHFLSIGDLVTSDKLHAFVGSVIQFSWFGSLTTCVVMAFDRYVVICRDEATKQRYFVGKPLAFWIVFTYCTALAFACSNHIPGWAVVFSIDSFSWSYEYAGETNIRLMIDYAVIGTSLVTMSICNFRVFVDIYKQHKMITNNSNVAAASRRKREVKICTQFLLITLTLMAFVIVFNVFTFLTWNEYLGIVAALVCLLWYTINGYVYLFLNSVLRRRILRFITCNTNSVGTSQQQQRTSQKQLRTSQQQQRTSQQQQRTSQQQQRTNQQQQRTGQQQQRTSQQQQRTSEQQQRTSQHQQ